LLVLSHQSQTNLEISLAPILPRISLNTPVFTSVMTAVVEPEVTTANALAQTACSETLTKSHDFMHRFYRRTRSVSWFLNDSSIPDDVVNTDYQKGKHK
jgi:hypothetical protein